MSWRIKLLMLAMIAAFAGFSAYYFRFYVAPKSHGIIVFVVPGLNLELLNASGVYEDGITILPEITKECQVAMVQNQTEPGRTNPVALISYFATGDIGLPDKLGLSLAGERLPLITQAAQNARRVTGMVSSGPLTSPMTAAFYGHSHNFHDTAPLARQLVESGVFNLILGIESPEFLPPPAPGDEAENAPAVEDPRLIEKAEANGYRIVRTRTELEDVPAWRTRQLLGLFPPRNPPRAEAVHPAPTPTTDGEPVEPPAPPAPVETPSLVDMTRMAIQCLQYHINGYFLVIHHPLTGPEAPSITAEESLERIRELDRAVKEARAYAGGSSIVILYAPYVLPVSKASVSEAPAPTPAPTRTTRTTRRIPPPPAVVIEPPQPYATRPGSFGWAAFYYRQPVPLSGFISPADLHQWLASQF